jgi:DNA-binding FadR family transcriptional regulator
MGLVRIRQGDGTRVENFMETAGLELVAHLVPLARNAYPEIVRDALEFRRVVAREVARLAAGRVEPEDLERLEEIARRAATPGLDPAEVFAHDFDFYIALTGVARNRVVSLLVNTVREVIKAYTGILMHVIVDPEWVRSHHEQLLAALEHRDADAAVAVVDEYMIRGTEHVLKMVADGRLVTNG